MILIAYSILITVLFFAHVAYAVWHSYVLHDERDEAREYAEMYRDKFVAMRRKFLTRPTIVRTIIHARRSNDENLPLERNGPLCGSAD